MSKRINVLTETAIIAAVAMVLSFIPDFAGWYSPSFGTIPLVLFALRRGPVSGTIAGLLWGLLHFPLGKVYFLSVSQVLIEYILAFTLVGLAGVFYRSFQTKLREKNLKSSYFGAIAGTFLAIIARYTCHFIAGIIFWADYAEGMSPELYSLSVNGAAGLSTFVLTVITIVILIHTQPRLFLPKNP